MKVPRRTALRRVASLVVVMVVATLAVMGVTSTVAMAASAMTSATSYEATTEDGVKVSVSAPQGALPDGAALHVDPVTSDEDVQVVTDELDEAEASYDGFAAFDVYFTDADGNEIEPTEAVSVRFELPEGSVPEGAEDLAVHHLAEAEDGTVSDVEAVADGADATEGTVAVQDDATVDAEFTVSDLSVFTVVWSGAKSSESDVMEASEEFTSDEVVPLSVQGRAVGDGSDMTINLHDYSRENPDINEGHTLKFGSVGGQAGENINAWTGSNGGVYQGIVASTIGDTGYPYLASNRNESLAYLFQSELGTSGVTSYDNVTGLFRLDSEGYYVYDSSENYAYYDEDSNSFVRSDYPRFDEYGDNGSIAPSLPQFLPFNSLTNETSTYDSSGNVLEQHQTGGFWNPKYEWGYYDDYGRWHQSDPAATGYNINGEENYSFGMDFTKTFYMPKDGQVNGEEMVFDFTGDDDVWVFIDDVLVLDLGGIHDAYNGSINFATGEVIVNATNRGQAIETKSIADIFEAAGEEWDGSDYSTHTIKFYYLERGNGGSNCRIRFNMPTVPDGTIEVGKQVTDTNTADFVNAEFTMKVDTADSENGPWSTYVGEYKLFDLDGNPIYDENGVQVTGQTNEDGTFTLKHDQVAQLTGAVQHEGDAEAHKIRANTWYKVTETGADGYSDDYEFDLQNTDLIDDSGDEQTDPSLIGKSKPVRVDRSARMVVRNRFTAKDKYSFSIQKHMEDNSTPDDTFYVKVTDADGNAVTGAQYYVRTIGEGVGETQAMPESGIIELKANQEIVILDVALGATFKVEEVNADGTPFTSDEFKDPKYAVQVGTDKTEPSTEPVTVTIEHSDGDQISYIAHVINAYQVVPVTAPMGIGITKTLNGLDLDENMFEFKIEAQATGEGDTAVSAEEAASKAGWQGTEITFNNGNTTAEAGEESDSLFNFGGDPVTQDRLTFTKDDAGKTYEYVISEVGLSDDYDGTHKSESEYVFDTTQYRIQLVPTIVQEDGADILHLAVYQATRDGSEGAWSDNELIATFDAYGPVHDGSAQASSRALVPYHTVNFTNSYQPLGLQIVKVDKVTDERLSGAYFSLTDSEGNSVVAYKTSTPSDESKLDEGKQSTNDQGILYFFGLENGEYTLTETRFPSGYQSESPDQQVEIKLKVSNGSISVMNSHDDWNQLDLAYESGNPDEPGSEAIANCFYLRVANTPLPDLPSSGSSGAILMMSVGIASVVLGMAYLARRKSLLRG
ncbi:SpaA isopeptide-forming pilin-related protein [Thermophilibacter sp. ZX-H3]|uniref:SpaA isopeptide-forming pilin-related protein n=1 Tax=unclassified Thermophilibacter TaxID=2847308 RepID=UPI0040408ECE